MRKRVGFLSKSILLITAASIALAYPMLFAQSDSASGTVSALPTSASPVPSFDVATVKPVAPGGQPTNGWTGVQSQPDEIEFDSQTLPELLCYAYGYKDIRFDGQITGLPDWAVNQRYDVVAKMSATDISTFNKLDKDEQDQWNEVMLQSLLAERFHLTLHRGSKKIPVYEMVVAKDGIKMKDSATDSAPPQLGKGADGKPLSTLRWSKDTTLMQAYSMKSLANLLSMPAAFVGRPVLDKTELTSTYDFTLDWSIYSARAAAGKSLTDDATSIFAALGKIGLKLQPATGDIETIVIDHVEKPSPN